MKGASAATSGSAGERLVVVRRVVTPRQVLGVASLGVMLAFVDATIVNVAFPDIREDFEGTSLAGISWVLNAYNIVFAALILAAGRIADLLGRKRLFEWGIVVFTLASGLCALAPTIEFLVGARMLQAVGAAIAVPASLALVLEGFPERERAHGVALWSAAAALAAGLGPSLGGVLVEAGGWRLAFLVNLPVGVLAVMASKRTLVESRAPGRRSIPDLFGAFLFALATATLTLGIVKGNEWGWGSPGVLVSVGAAVALGAAFVERCTWHRSPMVDLGLLRIRSIAVSNAVTLIAAAGFYAYVLCNVLFLTTVWGYSVLEAGLAITPGPFVAVAVARPASNLAERIGPALTGAAGAIVWAAGVAYLAVVVGPVPDFLGEWLPGMVILGIGAGIAFPVIGSAAVAEVTGGRFATATGINSTARQLGAVLGVALLVAIVGTPAPAEIAAAFDRGWIFAAACFTATAAGALAIGRIARPEPEPAAPGDREDPRGHACGRALGHARRPSAPCAPWSLGRGPPRRSSCATSRCSRASRSRRSSASPRRPSPPGCTPGSGCSARATRRTGSMWWCPGVSTSWPTTARRGSSCGCSDHSPWWASSPCSRTRSAPLRSELGVTASCSSSRATGSTRSWPMTRTSPVSWSA